MASVEFRGFVQSGLVNEKFEFAPLAERFDPSVKLALVLQCPFDGLDLLPGTLREVGDGAAPDLAALPAAFAREVADAFSGFTGVHIHRVNT
jgi:hypothetical protein